MKMPLVRVASAIVALACASSCVESLPERSLTREEQAELEAVQRVVDLTYQVSSFDDIATADPDAFRIPFTSTARLGYISNGELVARTVGDYVDVRRSMVEAGAPRSLVEWELDGFTELYGDVAHRISSYAVRIDGTSDIAERGIMSFQLLRVGGEWKVHSLVWDAESDDQPIPTRYLPGGDS